MSNNLIKRTQKVTPLIKNRGADFVNPLALSPCAKTRSLTGYRAPTIKQSLPVRHTAPVSSAIVMMRAAALTLVMTTSRIEWLWTLTIRAHTAHPHDKI
jgi:hypothetical protein